jgi:hypothetical protein
MLIDEFDSDTLAKLRKDGVDFHDDSSQNRLHISHGSFGIVARQNLVVQTSQGTIYVDKGSVVYLADTGNTCAVYTFETSLRGHVKALAGNTAIDVATGQHVLLTHDENKQFGELNPAKDLAHRLVEKARLSNGQTAFTGQFSILSAFSKLAQFKAMLHSENHEIRSTAQQVLKNAVAIAQVTGYKGSYAADASQK